MNELSIYKQDGTFSTELSASMRKYQDTQEIISSLKRIPGEGNETLAAMVKEHVALSKRQEGYILGMLKAYVDTLPNELASKQRFNGVPIDLMVKLKIDELVLNIRENPITRPQPCNFTIHTDYWGRYKSLSEYICGYGYNMYFIEERFLQFYPCGMHWTVLGFAEGYSVAFHAIAKEAGIQTQKTDPKTQDIWKNWPYFLKHDVHEYTLEGEYYFMYHGGINCSGNPNVPFGSNLQKVNAGVYEMLRNRNPEDFKDKEFNFKF
ncbi:MAG: hypothetical protein ACI4VQ_07590 [Clostridia bacterium]